MRPPKKDPLSFVNAYMIIDNPFHAHSYAIGAKGPSSTEKAAELTELIERGEMLSLHEREMSATIKYVDYALRLSSAIGESIGARAESRANRERSIAFRQYMDEVLTRARGQSR